MWVTAHRDAARPRGLHPGLRQLIAFLLVAGGVNLLFLAVAGDAYVLGLPDAPEVRHWVNSVREVRRGSAAQPIAHYEVFLQRMLGANGKPRYELRLLRID